MNLAPYLPFWDGLTKEDQDKLSSSAQTRTATAGEHVHDGRQECTGFLIVTDGQLRIYSLSESGREITLYRLLPGNTCLFSASCIIRNLTFDIMITAEKDTAFLLIPSDVYKRLMEENVAVSNYTNELMASRMSEVMWLMDQIMWQSFDKRLAAFLLEESNLNGSDSIAITHEAIANHLGSAREVVTRMLRYFQQEGLVSLSRGVVMLTDKAALQSIHQKH